jgi:hypothetical protein
MVSARSSAVALASSIFIFRVRYVNQNNDAPLAGSPQLHLYRGGAEVPGSPFVLQEADPSDRKYEDGKVYTVTRSLTDGNDYSYRFSAYDVCHSTALGEPCLLQNGPLVGSLLMPQAGEVKVVGPAASRGIINPDRGDTAMIFFQSGVTGTFTCRIFNSEGELLFEQTKQNVNNGYFEWVPKGIASGIYAVHVEGPQVNARRKLAILR